MMDTTPGPGGQRRRLLLRLAGAGLLVATGGIHLDLYLTGYRDIPTIGWLFLLQVIAAFALAAAVLAIRSPLADAGCAISTLIGYLLSLWIGPPRDRVIGRGDAGRQVCPDLVYQHLQVGCQARMLFQQVRQPRSPRRFLRARRYRSSSSV